MKLDSVSLPAGDFEVTVRHLGPDVPGVQPALLVDGFPRLLRAKQIAHHDVSPRHQHLAVAVRVRLADLGQHPVQTGPDRAQPVLPRPVPGLRPRRLRHPVALVQRDVQGQEVLERLAGHGRGPHAQNAHPVKAQVLLDLAEDQLLGQGVAVPAGAGSLPALDGLQVVAEAGALGPVGHDALEAAGALSNLDHLLLDLLVDPGDAEEEGGPDLLEGVDQGALERVPVGKVDGGLGGHGHPDVDHLGGGVAEGKVGDEGVLLRHAQVLVRDPGGEGQVVVGHHDTLQGNDNI